MNYPLILEYIGSIRAAEDNFAELNYLRPILDDAGNPVMSSGNFAVVFKMKDERTGKFHAVKCFLKEQEGRAEAYRMIAEELEYVSSTFLTPIKYLDKELFVDTNASDETEFPVLLMDWVEGTTLDKYIREHIDDQYELSLLAYQFSRLAMWLMPQPFAHGDLKPDNILVREDGTLVLVDYDGMYVPAMKGQKARELGSPDFRHPSRTENDFDEHIDDFSLASILLSLKAISLQPELLEEYGASDRLLFSEKDYRAIGQCRLLKELYPSNDSELNLLFSLYTIALEKSSLSLVSFRLFNLKRPEEPKCENLSIEVTDEDLTNAYIDKYGVKYSRDKKRLLKGANINSYEIRVGTKVICKKAFSNCDSLKSITIPEGLTAIGSFAFWGCNSLISINIPNSVNNIASTSIELIDGVYVTVVNTSKGNIYSKNFRSFEEECIYMGTNDFALNENKHAFFIGQEAYYVMPPLFGKSISEILKMRSQITVCDSSIDTKRWVSCLFFRTDAEKVFEGCKNLKQIIIPNGTKDKYDVLLHKYNKWLIEQASIISRQSGIKRVSHSTQQLSDIAINFNHFMSNVNWKEHNDLEFVRLKLPLLELNDDYILDAFECGDSYGSSFLPYVHRSDAYEQYNSELSYEVTKLITKRLSSQESKAIPSIWPYFIVPFTEEGIMQAWLLNNISSYMPKGWHANYGQIKYIFKAEDIVYSLPQDIKEEEKNKILAMSSESFMPNVNINGNEAVICVLYWNDWCGLVQRYENVAKTDNSIKFGEAKTKVLAKYDCGIIF